MSASTPIQSADLSEIAHGVIMRFGALAARRDVSVRLWAEHDSGRALVRRSEIRRLCENLLLRAIRVTPEQGTVFVRVSADDQDVFLAIADEGAGFHPRQAEASNPQLEACRRISTDNKGRLRWTTSEGFGSTFVLRVPRAGQHQTVD
ncbi:MAG: hypothetical protein RL885_26075 [Planctomycetota bacterium]